MSIFDPLLEKMKLNDDDDEYNEFEDEEDEDEEEEERPQVRERRQSAPRKPRKQRETYHDEEEDEERPEKPVRPVRPARNVVSMRSASSRGVNNSMEVCLIKPTAFDEGREIVDTLLSGRSVVINLEGIPTDIAQRIIDFASGACYSMEGNMRSISNYIVIVTPKNVDLTGDFGAIISAADGINVSMKN